MIKMKFGLIAIFLIIVIIALIYFIALIKFLMPMIIGAVIITLILVLIFKSKK